MSTVVIFEQDTLLRRSLRILLEMEGHTIVEVATNDGALNVMRQLTEPAILVVTHRVPEMDALLVLIRIANDPELAKRHRVVVIPSLRSPMQQPLPAAFGKLDVRILPVPYELHTLHAVIQDAARHQSQPPPTPDTMAEQNQSP